VKATLDAVHAVSGDGSVLAMDMWYLDDDPGPLGSARRLAPSALSVIGEPVTFGIHPEEIGAFLAPRGFTVTDLALATELGARYAAGDRALVDASMYLLAATRT
jgi:hypothetical protein